MSSVSVKPLALLSVGAVALLLAGCNSENVKTAEAEQAKVYTAQFAHSKNNVANVARIPVQSSRDTSLLDRVVWNAEKQKGKMYRYGGESPKTGFDCSGLTQFAFEQGAGVSLPRTAADQYAASVKIPKHEASKGDLVFFKTSGKRISHVGIYLGDEKFVHAPRTGKAITTDKLQGYWANKLVGFGRIPGACKPAYS
ncbi:Cell wall-associated hydrolase, NlpC family [Thiothrix caldifontis]|jgi:Cell wall-associated hydrolases (invasion-associated proteins)|uniref:Cell wall-associated hydrolase, NlpC family n=1 Tax=Thiothrix caldifontis TaxID=525918 RepID=A0A1H3XD23_9GAMM|nr:C40 family peptidase [Thiothrix caldifontis]SDZ97296.1 Cell wall-associated hydrolase, NlpC family [Thiothrix caldifontis]